MTPTKFPLILYRSTIPRIVWTIYTRRNVFFLTKSNLIKSKKYWFLRYNHYLWIKLDRKSFPVRISDLHMSLSDLDPEYPLGPSGDSIREGEEETKQKREVKPWTGDCHRWELKPERRINVKRLWHLPTVNRIESTGPVGPGRLSLFLF